MSYRASLPHQFIDVDRTGVSTLLEAVETALAAGRAGRSTTVIALTGGGRHSRLTALTRQTMLLHPTVARMACRLLPTCNSSITTTTSVCPQQIKPTTFSIASLNCS